MKKLVTATALSLALLGASFSVQANENIAYIDGGYVLDALAQAQGVQQKLTDEFKPSVEKLQGQVKTIETKIQALEKDAKKLRAADIKKREGEIQKLQAAYQQAAAKLQQQIQAREATIMQGLNQQTRNAINQVAKQKGYTLMLNSSIGNIVYAADGKDATQDVLKVLKVLPAETKAATK